MANRTKVGRQWLHSLLYTGMRDFHFKYLDSIFAAAVAKYSFAVELCTVFGYSKYFRYR